MTKKSLDIALKIQDQTHGLDNRGAFTVFDSAPLFNRGLVIVSCINSTDMQILLITLDYRKFWGILREEVQKLNSNFLIFLGSNGNGIQFYDGSTRIKVDCSLIEGQ